ncbi:putative CoA ligase ccl9 [Asimina triloba]
MVPCLAFVIMFLAVIRARAVAAPLNAAYTAEEFEFYLSDSESKLLITGTEGKGSAQAAAAKLNIPHATTELAHPDDPLKVSLDSAPASGSRLPAENQPSDVALFLHTSGTTSRPKGVPLTQLNLAASVKNIGSVYRLSESDSTVIVLPLFHVHGLVAGLLSSLAAGAAAALPAAGRFSASTFWSDMRAYGATWYTAVPTIHQILLDRHVNNPEASYPALRFIRSCSASLAPAILERLEAAFGAPVLEAYAMTEAAHQMSSNPLPEDGLHRAGSVGRPVGQEMAILDEEGNAQAVHVSGEVCVRGLNVTKGYKNNPEANQAAFRFGWLHTGDIGYLDDDGYLHLVGRIKELINRGAPLRGWIRWTGYGRYWSRLGILDGAQPCSPPAFARTRIEDALFNPLPSRFSVPARRVSVEKPEPEPERIETELISYLTAFSGEKISPIEVDAVLLSHPNVAQAVAFGVPDDKFGEEINCAIVPREGCEIDEGEVLQFCKKNLASFKVPKKVFITDSLPKTASGKIQRRIVAEHFLSQISAAQVPKYGA